MGNSLIILLSDYEEFLSYFVDLRMEKHQLTLFDLVCLIQLRFKNTAALQNIYIVPRKIFLYLIEEVASNKAELTNPT